MSKPAWRGGCVTALAIGVLTIAIVYGGLFLLLGQPRAISGKEWPYLLIQVLLAAAPFGLLARAGITSTLPWLVAIALTICFWGAFLFSVLASVRDQSGANIGMGLILLVSPLVIYGAARIVAKLIGTRT